MFVVDGTAHRILRATPATLAWQGRDADGEPADPGTVTVTVTRSDGTVVLAAGTATAGTGAERRTVALTRAQTEQLDVLFATWTVDGVDVATTRHDIVGGYYFDVARLKTIEVGATQVTAEQLVGVRAYVETTIEDVTGKAFVPRFDVVRLQGNRTDEVVLPRWYLRRVRWVRLWSDNSESTVLSEARCAAIPANAEGIMHLDMSTRGYIVEVGFEHGTDAPPFDVEREAVVFARAQINRPNRGLPDAATSLRTQEGAYVTIATPGTGIWHTGIPSVDDMLKRRKRAEVQLA